MIILISIGGLMHRKTSEVRKKLKKIQIKTSAVCGMCKDRIEEYMAYEKGVKEAELDLETKVLTIKYKTKNQSG